MSRKLKIAIGVVVLFLIYMTFFDQDNWLLQRERASNLKKTEENIEFLQQESKRMEQELKGLVNNPDIIEKNARENYFHKKDSEDVYIVIDTAKNREN